MRLFLEIFFILSIFCTLAGEKNIQNISGEYNDPYFIQKFDHKTYNLAADGMKDSETRFYFNFDLVI